MILNIVFVTIGSELDLFCQKKLQTFRFQNQPINGPRHVDPADGEMELLASSITLNRRVTTNNAEIADLMLGLRYILLIVSGMHV